MMEMLSKVLEQLSSLSLGHGLGSRVEEVLDDVEPIDPVSVDNAPVNDAPANDTPVNEVPGEETPADEILPYAVLEDSIKSILAALHDKQGIFSMEEARDIVDPLVALLKVMVSDEFLESTDKSESTYHSWCETKTKQDLAQLRKNLVTVQGMALCAQKLTLNDSGTKARRMGGGVLVSHARMRSWHLPNGSLSIISLERLRQSQQRRQRRRVRPLRALDSAQESADAAVDADTEIRIRYFPGTGQPRQGFQAILRQTSCNQGTFNAVPRLFAYNILPVGSRVFSLVSEGKMTEFQEMLRSETASLRDQDEFGASLLMVRYG